MIPTSSYSVCAKWAERLENPKQLAGRTTKSLFLLSKINRDLSSWYSNGNSGISRVHFDEDEISDQIERGVSAADDGTPEPFYGYHWEAFNSPATRWTAHHLRFGLYAGSDVRYVRNVTNFSTSFDPTPDASVVTFEIFRAALLAISEPFEPVVALAYSSKLTDLWIRGQASPTLQLAWITYLAPPLRPSSRRPRPRSSSIAPTAAF